MRVRFLGATNCVWILYLRYEEQPTLLHIIFLLDLNTASHVISLCKIFSYKHATYIQSGSAV